MPVTVDESAAAQLWTAKVPQQTPVTIGDPVSPAIDLREAYFFDPDGGGAIAAVPVGCGVRPKVPARHSTRPC